MESVLRKKSHKLKNHTSTPLDTGKENVLPSFNDVSALGVPRRSIDVSSSELELSSIEAFKARRSKVKRSHVHKPLVRGRKLKDKTRLKAKRSVVSSRDLLKSRLKKTGRKVLRDVRNELQVDPTKNRACPSQGADWQKNKIEHLMESGNKMFVRGRNYPFLASFRMNGSLNGAFESYETIENVSLSGDERCGSVGLFSNERRGTGDSVRLIDREICGTVADVSLVANEGFVVRLGRGGGFGNTITTETRRLGGDESDRRVGVRRLLPECAANDNASGVCTSSIPVDDLANAKDQELDIEECNGESTQRADIQRSAIERANEADCVDGPEKGLRFVPIDDLAIVTSATTDTCKPTQRSLVEKTSSGVVAKQSTACCKKNSLRNFTNQARKGLEDKRDQGSRRTLTEAGTSSAPFEAFKKPVTMPRTQLRARSTNVESHRADCRDVGRTCRFLSAYPSTSTPFDSPVVEPQVLHSHFSDASPVAAGSIPNGASAIADASWTDARVEAGRTYAKKFLFYKEDKENIRWEEFRERCGWNININLDDHCSIDDSLSESGDFFGTVAAVSERADQVEQTIPIDDILLAVRGADKKKIKAVKGSKRQKRLERRDERNDWKQSLKLRELVNHFEEVDKFKLEVEKMKTRRGVFYS